MTKDEIGMRLRRLREDHGYTQRELAAALGLGNASTVGSWEIGKSEPSLMLFSKLCSIYGIDAVKDVFPNEFGFDDRGQAVTLHADSIYDDDVIEFINLFVRLDSGDRREARGFVKALLTKPQYAGKIKAEVTKDFGV